MFVGENEEKHQAFSWSGARTCGSPVRWGLLFPALGLTLYLRAGLNLRLWGLVVPRNIFSGHATSDALEPTNDPMTMCIGEHVCPCVGRNVPGHPPRSPMCWPTWFEKETVSLHLMYTRAPRATPTMHERTLCSPLLARVTHWTQTACIKQVWYHRW